jgi:hypothetical protein
MRHSLTRIAVAMAGALAAALVPITQAAAAPHASIHCELGHVLCPELLNSEDAFGQGVYVGHDEPSLQFYSNVPGSGNRAQYQLTLPADPAPVPKNGRSFNFQLQPAFWFGIDLCDTNSYPNAVSTCTPDSDKNITPLAKHPGGAFFELQFYPPGWAPLPFGSSCNAHQYCVAIASFSVAEDPIHGTRLNPTCAAVTGIEYANYAFLTKSGHPHAPANPIDSTLATFTPDPATDLFMNPSDRVTVTFNDTAHGLRLQVTDQNTGERGSMTMSAANGFGMVKYAPPPSTECTNIPYDFHPMYDTSSFAGSIPWTSPANISFTSEIGHFDYCTAVTPDPGNAPFGICAPPAKEGAAGNRETAEGPPTSAAPFADDNFCFTAAQSTLVPISGCSGTNNGFDGVPYQRLWPDGNPNHAGPLFFTSPVTGREFDVQYQQIAFAADLPLIENIQNCDVLTGTNCTLIPRTDDGKPAAFYPFFSMGSKSGDCVWSFGNDIRGFTTNDFGKNAQYGSLILLPFLDFGGGGSITNIFGAYSGFHTNPCPSAENGDVTQAQ